MREHRRHRNWSVSDARQSRVDRRCADKLKRWCVVVMIDRQTSWSSNA